MHFLSLTVTSFLFLSVCDLYVAIHLFLLPLWVYCFSSPSPFPRLSLLWFYVDVSPLFSAIAPSQHCLSMLFPLSSLSSPVIFPVYLLSSFNLLYCYILFFILLAQGFCYLTCSNILVFIVQRPKVWVGHWLFRCQEPNVMDFHLYS